MLSLKVLRGPVLWNDRNESQLSLQNRPSIEEHWKQKPLGLSAVSHVCVEVGKDVVSHGGCLHAPLGLWRLWPCGLRLRGLRWFLHSNGEFSKLVVLPRFLAAANLLASDARHAETYLCGRNGTVTRKQFPLRAWLSSDFQCGRLS